jgi:hypothetical protein
LIKHINDLALSNRLDVFIKQIESLKLGNAINKALLRDLTFESQFDNIIKPKKEIKYDNVKSNNFQSDLMKLKSNIKKILFLKGFLN